MSSISNNYYSNFGRCYNYEVQHQYQQNQYQQYEYQQCQYQQYQYQQCQYQQYQYQQNQNQYYDVQQSFQNNQNSHSELTNTNTTEQQQYYYQNQQYQQHSQEQYYQIQQQTASNNSVNVQPIHTNYSKEQEQDLQIQQPINTNEAVIKTTLLAIENEICQICSSSKTVGLHYGAVTCEACKKFFIRCSEKINYAPICKRKTSDCILTPENRTCFRCRYDKCIKLGMDIESKLLN